jgi:ribosome maturation protein Sdo1
LHVIALDEIDAKCVFDAAEKGDRPSKPSLKKVLLKSPNSYYIPNYEN